MDLSNIKNLMHLFHKISSMEIALLDSSYRYLTLFTCPNNKFCHMVHGYSDCMKLCRDSDLEMLNVVAETHEPVKYTCPFGIYCAIAPIKKDGKAIAFLTYSLGVDNSDGSDEALLEKISALIPNMDAEEFKKCIASLPHHPADILESYADLLSLIADHITLDKLTDEYYESIAALTKRYIDTNLTQKLTLAQLSWKLHCSTVTLTQHFKNAYGMSIMAYVTQQRIQLAKEMLTNSSDTITSIANTCGFPDVEHFSRTFKKYYGCSPSQWRKLSTAPAEL